MKLFVNGSKISNLFIVWFHQVTRLCDLAVDNDSVTSVAWNERVSVFQVYDLALVTMRHSDAQI